MIVMTAAQPMTEIVMAENVLPPVMMMAKEMSMKESTEKKDRAMPWVCPLIQAFTSSSLCA